MDARRVAVVDLGTNSTRLLVADVEAGALAELERRTVVTRLGEGVDASGRLSSAAIGRVFEALGEFRELIDRLGAREVLAVATSAVRDAENGAAFRRELAERFGVEARTISGEEEARLTFLGATSGRARAHEGRVEDGPTDERAPRQAPCGAPTVVVDIGGGSTEYVVGAPGAEPSFHVSTEMGSVRHTERFLEHDPPHAEELAALADDAAARIRRQVARTVRRDATAGIAVAGTATSLAAIDQELEPYEPERVHGYRLLLAAGERILAKLAALPLDERRRTTGLHPDRAPTIVAGAAILVESMRAFALDAVEVSEADLLHGAALASGARKR